MATKKISELSTYTESSISDATQALVPLDDLTVVGTGKTKHMSFAEQAKWFGSHLPKLAVNPGVALTASAPFTLSQNWNNNAVTFEGVKIVIDDDASASPSKLFEVLGGAAGTTSLFSVSNDNNIRGLYLSITGHIAANHLYLASGVMGWQDGTSFVNVATNHIGVRNGANPQNLSVFNNYVSGSVYERGRIGWDTNVLEIGTEHVGGTARALALQTDGTTRMLFSAINGNVTVGGSVLEGDSGGLKLGAAGYLYWAFSTSFKNSSDGVFKITNFAENDFGRIQLGGTTSSYPSIARSGANIQIKLADNSALTGLEASVLTGSLYVAAPDIWANSNSGRLAIGSSVDLTLYRDAANHLALRNGANAQSFSVYGSYTSGSVYERARLGWASSVFQVGTEHVGATARNLALITDGTPRLIFTADGASMTRTYAGSYSGPATNAPLRIQADASGYGFIIANSATEYTSFLSGGVYKGIVGTGSVPLMIQNVGGQIELQPSSSSSVLITGVQEMPEVSAPAAPSANRVKIYAEDNGAGKTRLMAIFPSGAAQQIAIEP